MNGSGGGNIEIKYFWTIEYNQGTFYYWKAESEAEFLRKAKSFYNGRPFDYGETIKDSYEKGRKHETE